jgi:hypothetical protein
VEERRSTDKSLYHLLRKAGNGLSDILPVECLQTWSLKQEKVPVNHVTVEQEAPALAWVVHNSL